MGLLMNGFVKVPMQFLILLIGALVFCFYQFNTPPVFFDQKQVVKIQASPLKDSFLSAQAAYEKNFRREKNRCIRICSVK